MVSFNHAITDALSYGVVQSVGKQKANADTAVATPKKIENAVVLASDQLSAHVPDSSLKRLFAVFLQPSASNGNDYILPKEVVLIIQEYIWKTFEELYSSFLETTISPHFFSPISSEGLPDGTLKIIKIIRSFLEDSETKVGTTFLKILFVDFIKEPEKSQIKYEANFLNQVSSYEVNIRQRFVRFQGLGGLHSTHKGYGGLFTEHNSSIVAHPWNQYLPSFFDELVAQALKTLSNCTSLRGLEMMFTANDSRDSGYADDHRVQANPQEILKRVGRQLKIHLEGPEVTLDGVVFNKMSVTFISILNGKGEGYIGYLANPFKRCEVVIGNPGERSFFKLDTITKESALGDPEYVPDYIASTEQPSDPAVALYTLASEP